MDRRPATETLARPRVTATAQMTTVVGVDAGNAFEAAVDLLSRIKFEGNHLTLVHVEEPLLEEIEPGRLVSTHEEIENLERTVRRTDDRILGEASAYAKKKGLGPHVNTLYTIGNPAASLMQIGTQRHADLVAVGSSHEGPLQSFFLGSVGRALAIHAHNSFLVARKPVRGTGGVRAVFATDFSPYAERCFRQLLALKPEGLESLTVVTALDRRTRKASLQRLGLDENEPFPETALEAKMRDRGEEMASKLRQRGIDSRFRFAEGHPVEVLRQAMLDTDSELLILGARGHGFVERLAIGSLALHAVVAEPYSVLVLRNS